MTNGGKMQEQATERGYTVEELLAAARRRARPALVVMGAALVLGAVAVAAMPDEYRAEATIILEPYRPHPELVTPAVTTLLEDRMRVARQQLLAGPHLAEVVQQFHLYPDQVSKHGIEAGVDALKKHLEVKPDGDSAIVLSFRTANKGEAAKVVSAVAHGFVDANAKMRVGQAERVHDMIADELVKVTKELDAQEKKVRDFRLAHDGELPEQMEANLREAERATHELDTAQAWLHDLEHQRALLPTTPTSPEVERLAVIESDLVRQLNHAESVYAPDHPETVRLTRELEGIRKDKQEAMGRAVGNQQERVALDRAYAKANRDAEALEAKVQKAKDRAQAAAKWAADMAILVRDRDELLEKYKSLLSRKVESEVALGLEEKSAPLATNVVDPPADVGAPAAPDRMKLFAAVLALAMGLGVGVGVWLESKDGSVRTPAQARAQLDVPLLAVVPGLRGRG